MRLALLISIIIFLFSCSSPSGNSENSDAQTNTLASKVKEIKYEVIATEGSGITIKELSFDTTLLHHIKGVKVTFTIDVSKEAIEKLNKEGYTSYFLDLCCEPDKGSIYSHKKVTKPGEERINVNHGNFISMPGQRSLEMLLPFRLLEMEKGEHIVTVTIGAFPARFKKDTISNDYKILEKVMETAHASTKVKIKIIAPKLYKVVVQNDKFWLNTTKVKPSMYDFSFGGPGYPDIFWSLACGDDFVYHSTVMKNCTNYSKPSHSTPFYCTEEDEITITVADYDDGPFNKESDIIGVWKGKITDLPKTKADTLSFGNVEAFIVETKLFD